MSDVSPLLQNEATAASASVVPVATGGVAHTARFDEKRYTLDDQYPLVLQSCFSKDEWRAFVTAVNTEGEAYQARVEQIIKNANPGAWMACACLCCICGPCILMWKLKNIAVSLIEETEKAQSQFEAKIKSILREYQEKKSNAVGITLKSEEAQRTHGTGDNRTTTTYRKYWLEFALVAAPAPVVGAPVEAKMINKVDEY